MEPQTQFVEFPYAGSTRPAYLARSGRKLDRALDRFAIPHDIKIYPGARHSFFNDQEKAYDAAASADSWRRVLAFFGEHLGSRA